MRGLVWTIAALRRAAPALLILLPVAAAAAAAADPQPRTPTGKWIVDFAESECLLIREYGTHEKPLLLAASQSPMDEGLQLIVLKHGSRASIDRGTARVAFGAGAPIEADYGAFLLAGKPLRRIAIEISDDSYKAAEAQETIAVEVAREVNESFAVPGFARALEVLQDCVLDLGTRWGFPAEQQKRLGKPAKPFKKLREYFMARDYPTAALRAGASGRSRVRVTVDESGRPADCVVMESSGHAALDSTTCSVLMRRAQFEPALDVDGKPMKAVAVANVYWVVG